MSTQRIFGGQTEPGATDWQQFGDPAANDSGIFVDVNTSSGNFLTTPIYVASLGGNNDHWTVSGSYITTESSAGYSRFHQSSTHRGTPLRNQWPMATVLRHGLPEVLPGIN